MQDQIRALITEWIVQNKRGATVPTPDQDLLRDGVIDSLDYLTIVEFVSGKLGIEVDMAEFDDAALGTVAEMARQISKQAP